MRPVLFLSPAVLIAVTLAVLAGAGLAVRGVVLGPGPLTGEAVVTIPPGAGLDAIARQLHEAGVVARPRAFALAARLTGAERSLHAGQYRFSPGVSPAGVLELLRQGRVMQHRLTVPEGLASAQIVAMLRAEEALSGVIDAVPPEGALLPETYYFSGGAARAGLLRRMEDDAARLLAALWPGRAAGLPLDTPEDAVILASIVEKETAVPAERPRVAAVMINRLRRGIRLQSDPTVIYGLTGGAGPLDRPLRRADLRRRTPYNTYRITGLPPAAICNPGRASLAAVLHPDETDELYFVADGSGGHAFARTLEEHNRNVARWRKLQRQRRTGQGGH